MVREVHDLLQATEELHKRLGQEGFDLYPHNPRMLPRQFEPIKLVVDCSRPVPACSSPSAVRGRRGGRAGGRGNRGRRKAKTVNNVSDNASDSENVSTGEFQWAAFVGYPYLFGRAAMTSLAAVKSSCTP